MRSRAFKVIRTVLIVLVSIAVLSGAAAAVFVYSIISDAPEVDTKNIRALLSENSIIYDSKGNVLDSVFLESRRTNVNYASLPENLKNAFIAVEDKTFWEHHGFNVVRILGAVVESIKTGEKISGTSTITQQLARNLYLAETRSEYSIKRKVIEAYYAVLLENDLTKEQILEAYLNRVSLGFGTSGVQAAAQAYFSKNVDELTLPECAAIAAIIQEPNSYSLIKTLPNASVAEDNEDVLYRDETYAYLYNGGASESRRHMILGLMREQELISPTEYREAVKADLRNNVKPFMLTDEEKISYFTDFAINQVVTDLAAEFNFSEQDAWDMLFNSGLRVYTTVDVSLQGIVEKKMVESENFPGIARLSRDRAGNIRRPAGGILLYNFDNYFDAEGNFVLSGDEYERQENGDVLLRGGGRLNFYRTESNGLTDYSIKFKSMYDSGDGVFNAINEGTILIPSEYKDRDENGNLIIAADFFSDHPDFFRENEGTLTVAPQNYTLSSGVMQPQAAMVIIDYATGEIKAMAGGRNTTGRLLYNRAANPRQPGSAIKPMAVYGPALQSAAETVSGVREYAPGTYVNLEPAISLSGRYWTAASVIYDAPLFFQDRPWPKNWYEGNRGAASLRRSVEQSINVNAVKVFSKIGPEYSLDFLKKLGVTTVVEAGEINDMNAAALALGGMSAGISPLEMAGAYGTFANGGRYNRPVAYTKVTGRNGEVILENTPQNTQVMDPGAAFIMTDILRTTVSSGIARRASVAERTVAGKTGTTSENYDAWFVGLVSGYSASLWIGNDVNIELDEGSMAAARLWSEIMTEVLAGMPERNFLPMPENVVGARGEYFIRGTQGSSLTEAPPVEEVAEGEAGADGTVSGDGAGASGPGTGQGGQGTSGTENGTGGQTGTGTESGSSGQEGNGTNGQSGQGGNGTENNSGGQSGQEGTGTQSGSGEQNGQGTQDGQTGGGTADPETGNETPQEEPPPSWLFPD